MLTLLTGMLQVASLARTHTDAIVEARRHAAERAMTELPRGQQIRSNPAYLRTWRIGPDQRLHTRDDVPVHGDPQEFRSAIVQRAAPSEHWDLMSEIPHNRMVTLRGSDQPETQFGLLRGRYSRTVPLLPAVRHLFYDAENIDIEAETWMTWLKGLY